MSETYYSNGSAVYARSVCFSYSKSDQILKGINLTIERASIYGLLGSSGCGKTTLLKCILGRLKPKSGTIQIFGSKPGTPECHIPGAGVGYMPQELGLYFEFTIKEILSYFGRIYAMEKDELGEKCDQLIKLLQLPQNNKFIGHLSGGQQRRVSLACTLIHSPPLLILDEPTVGTDPVLRKNIWFHLLSLCKSGHTIIVTTHYIEEARNAKTVAFMRNGKILAEENPDVLLEKYQSTNLEDVFLRLCISETKDSKNGIPKIEVQNPNHCYENTIVLTKAEDIDKSVVNSNLTKNGLFPKNVTKNDVQILDTRSIFTFSQISGNNLIQCLYMIKKDDNDKRLSADMNEVKLLVQVRDSGFKDRCSALLHKNYKKITRNLGHLFFEIVFTALLAMIVLISISDGPTNLNLAIYDEEIIKNVTNNFGKLFVKHIDKNIFKVKYYDSLDAAIDSIKLGQNYAAVEINQRFSNALRLRFLYMTDKEILDDSQIHVHIDRSNQLIGLQIDRYLYETTLSFIKEAANISRINPELFELPLLFEDPIYGDRSHSLKEYVIPGMYVVLTFFTTTTITTHLIHEERRDGLLERSLVAGITFLEFLVSTLMTQFIILCIQIVFLLILPYIMFGQQIPGSLILFIGLSLSQGFCGVIFGLMIALLVSDTIMCGLCIVSFLLASLIMGGVIWPIENMPTYMQFITKLFPNTLSVQSMRNIMYRKWTIDHFEVYIGFVSTYVWFTVFMIISLISMKRNF